MADASYKRHFANTFTWRVGRHFGHICVVMAAYSESHHCIQAKIGMLYGEMIPGSRIRNTYYLLNQNRSLLGRYVLLNLMIDPYRENRNTGSIIHIDDRTC